MNDIPPFNVAINGKTYKAQVSQIRSFTIGMEDHGIFTAMVHLEGAGWGQGMPAYSLSSYDRTKNEHVASEKAGQYLLELINAIGDPSTAVGRQVVVFREKPYDDIKGIALMKKDGSYGEPFFPEKIFKP